MTYFGTGNLVETDSNEIDPPTTYAYYGNDSAHPGRIQSITNGNGGTIFLDYDDRGNEDHRWGTATYEIKRTYNLYGQLEQLETFRNPGQPDTTTWHYDPATGLLHQKEYADHKHVTYDYWPNGQVKTRLWARGITTSYAYDNAGTLETVTYSDDTPSITYTRDRNGRIDTVSDAAGLHTLDHRPDGQLLSSVSAGGLLDGWQIVYQPDALGRTEGYQVKNNGQNVAAATRGYDTAGRLGTLSTGDNEVRYRYDPVRGLRTGTDHYHKALLALSNDRAFDAAGRIDFVQSRRRDNATILLRDYTLDDLGRRERADDEEDGHWSYGYNDRSEVVGGAKHRPNGGAIPAASFAYDFDGIGNRKTHTIGDFAPVSYTPNNLNQYAQVIGNEQAYIVGRTAEGAAVTINGQPAAVEDDGFFSGLIDLNNGTGPSVTEVTIDADKAGKQTQETGALRSAPVGATWQYDDDGNLLSDGLWDYTWNGENRLIAAETVATISNAYRVRKEYVYDYQGRRVVESRWEFDETSGDYVLEDHLRWTYDNWNPVAEITNDQPSRHYVWGLDLSETPQGAGGVGGLLMSLDLSHASLSYSFVYDGNGNVLGLVNLANGELIGRYEYSPFGKLLWKEGLAAEINRWRFSTKLEDDGMGWLYYGFRYYDPETGRWPSRDPIGEQGGVNLYGFVGNDPVGSVDLRGAYTLTFRRTVNWPWPGGSLNHQEKQENRRNFAAAMNNSSVIKRVAELISDDLTARVREGATSKHGQWSATCLAGYEKLATALDYIADVMTEIERMRDSNTRFVLAYNILYGHLSEDGTGAFVAPEYWLYDNDVPLIGGKVIFLGQKVVPASGYLHELAHLTVMVPYDYVGGNYTSMEKVLSGYFYEELAQPHIRSRANVLASQMIETGFMQELRVKFSDWGGVRKCCEFEKSFRLE